MVQQDYAQSSTASLTSEGLPWKRVEYIDAQLSRQDAQKLRTNGRVEIPEYSRFGIVGLIAIVLANQDTKPHVKRGLKSVEDNYDTRNVRYREILLDNICDEPGTQFIRRMSTYEGTEQKQKSIVSLTYS